ncbi:alkyl hydroperoxide reductase subunit F [Thalassotalea ponticola]|uniref:alkyl hydroperoxide reductase subunit F n=1 Tax=Thalassotalea ponticola TaxID=1523392 RepID=UPI0025B5D048|nr:alkyl hydroperoxide reductase subunit F [Thalassotalea ponticola]MDN3652944.1 alkyl hydroperoxide reductase subunit F [Thalassotalea ponticola]
MLSQEILTTLKSYTADMAKPVTLVLQTGEHAKRDELVQFLNQLCSVSDNLHLKQADISLRSPLSFVVEVDGALNGIIFSGIPGGHEFNSLVLAILQSSGSAIKLDNNIKSMLEKIDDELHFEVFVSLSCHNCPDVVQALNQFALVNEKINSEMIDGGEFQDIIAERNIQGVPSVYLNGELFANGKIDTAQLIDKLVQRYSYIAQQQSTEQLPLQDVTVIGSGPAGVAAAIYAARKGLNVTVVGDRFGGQVKDTVDIENLISVSKTTGNQLAANLQAHLNDYQITLKEHVRVDKIETPVDAASKDKTLYLSSGEVINSKTVIIATGAKWRQLGVPGEQENIGSGVAYCPHCDGPFFKGKNVAVVGGGNSGIEAALDLAGMVNHVTVLEFMEDFKADQVLLDKAQQHPKINLISNAKTEQITAAGGKVNAIEYTDRVSNETRRVDVAGVFVQIGLVPNSDFLQNAVECTPYGEVIIDEKCQTSTPGIYAAGDVSTVPYKQIVIAMGEGSKAALSAFEYIIKEY